MARVGTGAPRQWGSGGSGVLGTSPFRKVQRLNEGTLPFLPFQKEHTFLYYYLKITGQVRTTERTYRRYGSPVTEEPPCAPTTTCFRVYFTKKGTASVSASSICDFLL